MLLLQLRRWIRMQLLLLFLRLGRLLMTMLLLLLCCLLMLSLLLWLLLSSWLLLLLLKMLGDLLVMQLLLLLEELLLVRVRGSQCVVALNRIIWPITRRPSCRFVHCSGWDCRRGCMLWRCDWWRRCIFKNLLLLWMLLLK